MNPEAVFDLLTKAKAEAGTDYRALALQLAVQYYAAQASRPPTYNITGTWPNINITGWGASTMSHEITAMAKAFLDFLEAP